MGLPPTPGGAQLAPGKRWGGMCSGPLGPTGSKTVARALPESLIGTRLH